MDTGWRYRIVSVLGVAVLSALTVVVVNNSAVQTILGTVPPLGRLPTDPPSGAEFTIEMLLTVNVVAGSFLPLYKSRPRRIVDIVALAHKRVLVAIFALATIGYFDYSYKLPRVTILLLTPILLIALPLWFIWLRRPSSRGERAIIVGDDLDHIAVIAREVELPLLGYLSPTPARMASPTQDEPIPTVTDGGKDNELQHLGGLSRLEDMLVEYDVDTAVLAFSNADRAEFL